MMASWRPDVIVSDMRMPGMDGAAFLAAARALAPTSVRILLTAQTDVESAARAVNAGGIYKLLTKPCPYDSHGRGTPAGRGAARRAGRRQAREAVVRSDRDVAAAQASEHAPSVIDEASSCQSRSGSPPRQQPARPGRGAIAAVGQH